MISYDALLHWSKIHIWVPASYIGLHISKLSTNWFVWLKTIDLFESLKPSKQILVRVKIKSFVGVRTIKLLSRNWSILYVWFTNSLSCIKRHTNICPGESKNNCFLSEIYWALRPILEYLLCLIHQISLPCIKRHTNICPREEQICLSA